MMIEKKKKQQERKTAYKGLNHKGKETGLALVGNHRLASCMHGLEGKEDQVITYTISLLVGLGYFIVARSTNMPNRSVPKIFSQVTKCNQIPYYNTNAENRRDTFANKHTREVQNHALFRFHISFPPCGIIQSPLLPFFISRYSELLCFPFLVSLMCEVSRLRRQPRCWYIPSQRFIPGFHSRASTYLCWFRLPWAYPLY